MSLLVLPSSWSPNEGRTRRLPPAPASTTMAMLSNRSRLHPTVATSPPCDRRLQPATATSLLLFSSFFFSSQQPHSVKPQPRPLFPDKTEQTTVPMIEEEQIPLYIYVLCLLLPGENR
ncbi:hypothetical protein BHE74_00010428 [Ensete ventricosum]|nr:hypothetical protein BHE74_00010428 [Ensete ventricosum]